MAVGISLCPQTPFYTVVPKITPIGKPIFLRSSSIFAHNQCTPKVWGNIVKATLSNKGVPPRHLLNQEETIKKDKRRPAGRLQTTRETSTTCKFIIAPYLLLPPPFTSAFHFRRRSVSSSNEEKHESRQKTSQRKGAELVSAKTVSDDAIC